MEKTKTAVLDVLTHKTAPNYSFMKNGTIVFPNRNQVFYATSLKRDRRMICLSGMGAGKTLMGVYASRHLDACLTIIVCPNNVIGGWKECIISSFPDSKVVTKNWHNPWHAEDRVFMILNFEMFQQEDSEDNLLNLTMSSHIDFIILDEVQLVKQRGEVSSKRRLVVNDMIRIAGNDNPHLAVLALSGTPVVNNLREAVSLIEMVTGVDRPELAIEPTAANCAAIHAEFCKIGHRWTLALPTKVIYETVRIDASDSIPAIMEKGKGIRDAQMERILTEARIPAILEKIVSKTLIYTHLVEGVVDVLKEEVEKAGWKVGVFTGQTSDQNKVSLKKSFIEGDLDVLIVSSAIATGVNGLQEVCNRLIINILPWTSADFDQLVARLQRQGQKHNVTVFIIETYAEIDGVEWSYCAAKAARIDSKRALAAACVDGAVYMNTALATMSEAEFENKEMSRLQELLITKFQ